MTEKKMKPVWRMNTGNGVPSDYGGLAYTPRSAYKWDKYSENWTLDRLWSLTGHIEDIYAYQTTRTKPAKYR